MQKLLSILALLALASPALAHESRQPIKMPLTSEMADVTRHCVYAGKLYSRGSVVKQPDGNRVCEKVSFGAEPFMLGWDKAK